MDWSISACTAKQSDPHGSVQYEVLKPNHKALLDFETIWCSAGALCNPRFEPIVRFMMKEQKSHLTPEEVKLIAESTTWWDSDEDHLEIARVQSYFRMCAKHGLGVAVDAQTVQ